MLSGIKCLIMDAYYATCIILHDLGLHISNAHAFMSLFCLLDCKH